MVQANVVYLYTDLLPAGSEQHEVLLFGNIYEEVLQACHQTVQIEKNTLKYWYSWVVKKRNTSEAVLRPQYTPWPLY